MKNKVKTEKGNFIESLDKVKRNQNNEANDITSVKLETFLNNMNIKHSETVCNMLNIFKSNKNLNGIIRLI